MPTPDNTVSLLIGGKVHGHWSRYDIDSDLLIPADAWHVELGLPDGQFPPVVTEGAAVEVRIGSDTVMTGRIDDITTGKTYQAESFPAFMQEIIESEGLINQIRKGIAK